MNESQIIALIAGVLLAGKYNDNANDAVNDAVELVAVAQLKIDRMAHARMDRMRKEAAAADAELTDFA